MSIHIFPVTCTFASDCTCKSGYNYVLPYKAKISAQHEIDFILDRCIVYLGLTMPNLQKKRLLIFEIFNIKKCTFFFEPSIVYFNIPLLILYLSAIEILICYT